MTDVAEREQQLVLATVELLRDRVVKALADAGARSKAQTQAVILGVLQEHAMAQVATGHPPPAPSIEDAVLKTLLDDMHKTGEFEPFLHEPYLEELRVNGHDRVFAVYAGGRKERVPSPFPNLEALHRRINHIVTKLGSDSRHFDEANPWVSIRLRDGLVRFTVQGHVTYPRLNVVMRVHRLVRATLADWCAWGSISPHLQRFLEAAVLARLNIVVCGGMFTGKTTLLRALCAAMPRDERKITIEHARELGLELDPDTHPDVIACEARQPNSDGRGGYDCDRLFHDSLAMSADRVIVGEVRGSEVRPMLHAMSIGVNGTVCSVHARSAVDAYRRLAVLLGTEANLTGAAAVDLIASAVDLVVFSQGGPTGRYVAEVVATSAAQELGSMRINHDRLYEPGGDGRAAPVSGALPGQLAARLAGAGYDLADWHDAATRAFRPLDPAPAAIFGPRDGSGA